MRYRTVKAILWAGLAGFMLQWALFLRLTFWELSWDVMEPVRLALSQSRHTPGTRFQGSRVWGSGFRVEGRGLRELLGRRGTGVPCTVSLSRHTPCGRVQGSGFRVWRAVQGRPGAGAPFSVLVSAHIRRMHVLLLLLQTLLLASLSRPHSCC